CPGVQSGEPSVGAILAKDPVECTEHRPGRSRNFIRLAARAPRVEGGQQHGLGALYHLVVIGAERLVLDRTARPSRPHRYVEEISAAAVLEPFRQNVSW